MTDDDFPAALAALAAVGFPYGGDEADYEPYDAFLSAEWATDWFRAWTGNPEVDGDRFRIFGQDGSGGYAVFWLARAGAPLTSQPIAFLGSEGQLGIVARDLSDFLWLLADGSGPYEAVDDDWAPRPVDPAVVAIAEQWARPPRRTVVEVVTAARAEFPDFVATIDALVR